MDDRKREKILKAYNAVAFVQDIQSLPPEKYVLALLDPNNPLEVYKRALEEEKAEHPPAPQHDDSLLGTFKRIQTFVDKLFPNI